VAQKSVVILTDDLDGTEQLKEGEGETVNFALDGQQYEIDLSHKTAEKMRKALETYVNNARRADRPSISSGRSRARGGRVDASQTSAIRAWAGRNGYDVSRRGRIPRKIVEAFHRGG